MTRTSFHQRYQQVVSIGAGGMGEVFKGHDPRSGRWVAIKLLHPSIAADKIALLRFEREIKTQAELDHTNIAPLFGVEDFKEGPCMIMQYVDGVGLNHLIVPGKPLDQGIAFRILDGVLAGMGHAHGLGIVHRDLKPSNILIGKRGVPKIIDFGIAKPENDQDVTKMGSAPGTISYMAPELHTATQPASKKSDVFSLGIIAYELFTGTHPFRRDTPFATTQAILSQSPTPMQTLVPGLPRALWVVILSALDKDPTQRPKSAEELRVAIANCGVAAATEQQLQSVVAEALTVAGKDAPGGPSSNSAVRAPAATGLSRSLRGLLQLNWMFYVAAILLLTAAAVAYLVISVRKPAQSPVEAVTPAAPVAQPVTPPAAPASNAAPPGDAALPSVPPVTPAPAAAAPVSAESPGTAPAADLRAKKPTTEAARKPAPRTTRTVQMDPAAEEKDKERRADEILKKKDQDQ